MSLRWHNSADDCLESCSNPQKTQQVFNEKNSLVLGFVVFVSDIISGVVLGLFGPLHLALRTNL